MTSVIDRCAVIGLTAVGYLHAPRAPRWDTEGNGDNDAAGDAICEER